jgi:high affinity sulfate transporter 1
MMARRLLVTIAPGLAALSRYDRQWLRADVLAGLSVAAVALPVGIAYADLARVPPIIGIYSAIFPLLAYALFGSSRQLIIGPDAATCLLVVASLAPLSGDDQQRYLALLPVLTLLTSFLYLVAGALRLGFIANFLSKPILTGYLNGIALLILAGQLPKLFGYAGQARSFVPQIEEFVGHLGAIHAPTVAVGLVVIAGLLILRQVAPSWPASLVAVIGGIAAVALFDLRARGVGVIGALPSGMPAPQFPTAEVSVYRDLFDDAAAIMLISFTSGMLTARSFAQRNHYKVNANQELIALGLANLVSGLVQGFVVTGADSRTAVNNVAGGRSQLTGIAAALTMLFILLFAREPLALVPSAVLGAIVFVSAMSLFDVGSLLILTRMNRKEGWLAAGTTLGVLTLGVLPTIGLTVALSLAWLLWVTSRPHVAVLGHVDGLKGFHSIDDYPTALTMPGLLLFRFEANLLFFNVDYFTERLTESIAACRTAVSWVVVDARPINWIDATAVEGLASLRRDLAAEGIVLSFSEVRLSLGYAFRAAWLDEWRRSSGISTFPTLDAAIAAFEEHVGHRDLEETDRISWPSINR